ncbi:glycosyltransferase [Formicincola oecophyllae]|uniref:Glycosyltransferase n=1 Tax=Formicincola oecophyllae TaxID=2558361 RepID=A0A4Y6UAA3_9PROT|nr:glycosyltransferase [Formicincola oecophyllae]QDH13508.1 glycosyltransferase [Formicincola oecophyllae]
MKITYIISTLKGGGAQSPVPAIIKALEAEGNEVRLVACQPSDGRAMPNLKRAGIVWRLLNQDNVPVPFYFFTTLWNCLKLLSQDRPDVIWTSLSRATAIAQIAGWLLKIPVVSWQNSTSLRSYTRIMTGLSKLWVADSSVVAHYMRDEGKVPAKRVVEWPIYKAQTSAVPPLQWDGVGRFHIGSSGRLHEVKNYPALIEGLALFKRQNPQAAQQVHLTILGEGPERAKLEALVRQHGLESNVTLPGFSDDVPSFLESLHLYLQPSRYEGMCLALHEAMAAGVPCAATPFGQMRESLDGGRCGFVIDPANPAQSIAAILAHAMANQSALRDMALIAQKNTLSQFGPEAFQKRAQNVLAMIQKAIKPKP